MKKEDLIKLKSALLILALGLVVSVVLLSKVLPLALGIPKLSKDIKEQTQQLEDDKRRISDKRRELEKPVIADDEQLLRAFFETQDTGLSSEAILSMEFDEILKEMRKHQIKARSIKYDYNPEDDAFVKGAADTFQVCKISMEMIGKYVNFRNFIRDLYSHQHFLEISKIEIAPYMKDKRILLINLQIKIYAKVK